MLQFGAFTGGQMRDPDAISSDRALIVAPWNGAPLGEVALAPRAFVEETIDAAHRAFLASRLAPQPLQARIAVLEKIARALEARTDTLAKTLSDEAGKPIALARSELKRAAATFADAAEGAKQVFAGESLALDAYANAEGRVGLVRRFPVGVVAAITPFNFPLNLVAHKVAPAIAAGCPIVLKPAPQTPLSAFALAQIVAEAGLPPDHLHVVYCSNEDAAPLIDDPRVATLTFTGSARVGWALEARARRKKVTLELGGNAAVIVHDAPDLDAVAARVALGSNSYAGQTCISVQRIFVRRALLAPFRDAYLRAVAAQSVGDPALASTVVGPVIDDRAADRITSWVDSAASRGARVHGDLARRGRLLRPVVLEDVPADHPIACDEVFGPACALAAYDEFDDALERVNRSRYGLQAGLYTRDVGLVFRALERLSVGGVIHDDVPTFRVDAMPYGGVKDSGRGREGGRYAIEDMTEPRLLVLRH